MSGHRPLRFAFLGRLSYAAAVALQESLRRSVIEANGSYESQEALLLAEHHPVVTLGRSANPEHVLVSEAALAARGIALARSSRGGDVTYHGPGQLVAYPVVRLAAGVLAHVEALAEAARAVAGAAGVEAEFRRDPAGVWVGPRKLAAVGVHVHRRVAIHGLALNLSTDLAAFNLIVPCGLCASPATSLLAESGRTVSLDVAAEQFAVAFCHATGRTAVEDATLSTPSLISRSADVK